MTVAIGGYLSGREPARLIRDSVVELCAHLKNEAVALVDAVAPPDFILNSPIGSSDGQVRTTQKQFSKHKLNKLRKSMEHVVTCTRVLL